MRIQLNQHVQLSRACDIAVDVHKGQVHIIEPESRQRLAQLQASGSLNLASSDLPLLEQGVVQLAPNAVQQAASMRVAIKEYLATRAALCIMPTEKCNFRCVYCYETFAKGRMNPDVAAGIINYLKRNVANFRSYALAWFGGEPLLQPDLVAAISVKFREIHTRAGVLGSIAVTTNGSLLTDEVLRQLEPADIDLYQVTVDGPMQIHDRQRLQLNGRSTYRLVTDNIERLLAKTAAHVIFRVNLDTSQAEAAGTVSSWLREEIVPRYQTFADRVSYHVVSVWDATTQSVDGICIADLQRFHTWYDVKRSLAEAQGESVLASMAHDVAGIGSLACYAGKPNHYVIGADGAVYKCTVAFDLDENQIGQLHPDGAIALDPDKEAIWVSANSLTDSGCGLCSFHASCMGIACPLTRLQTGQRPCPTHKRFFVEAISSPQVCNDVLPNLRKGSVE